jgi:hypothetical protein
MIIHRTGDWLRATVGDETVIMGVDAGRYVVLNEVGAAIWGLIEEPISIEQLQAELIAMFEVTPETCRRDLDSFLATLVDFEAVHIEPASGN